MSEKEQSAREIQLILEFALEEKCPVDLVILSSKGEPRLTPNLLIEEIGGDILMVSYLDADGEPAEVIPLEMFRIKEATIIPQALR